jgi:hypothetical protein
VLAVRAREAAEWLLRFARIAVAQDDQAATWDLLEQHAVALDDCIGDRTEQRLERVQHLLSLARRHRSLRPQLLLDQRRQLCRPVLGRPRHVEPPRQLRLWHEQEHHNRGQTLSAAPRPIGRAAEAS